MTVERIDASVAGRWKLGDTFVNRMGFGSMRLTVRADRERAVRVLRRAVELGVDHIDTAAFYFSPGGILDGEDGPVRYATELIREALTPYPEGLMIVTKVGPDPRADGGWGEAITAEQLRRQVEENLRRLGVKALDLVNLRITRDRERFAERFGALAEMRAEGLIRHLGISNVGVEQLDEAQRIAPVACVQNAFAADLRRHEDLLRECGARGIAFVPFFAIAGSTRESGVAAGDAGPEWRIARRRGVTGHQVRLAWTLHQGPHVLAIPGTGDVAHLEENIAAGGISLTAEELAEIDQR
ncbi:oxidoreductase [Actinoplanes lobatus]|uniref:Oxidoreductase n=1 Tax=Actinoplanes lobatus TaxID=113568 RepID=A0A7W7HEJ0_9ACTN|nr:aldo/keto reductase [Actinoplanes lobatus]MBB4749065.1 aryl-alcohol dehydrogenase-like predicted oxidoreductase [Actinoplanes lobatus]GGN86697.1 oxidoreductase [Actinoplanes lobatus]GIE42836.1 oxidoreductase [Actinoplanes lobatus]